MLNELHHQLRTIPIIKMYQHENKEQVNKISQQRFFVKMTQNTVP